MNFTSLRNHFGATVVLAFFVFLLFATIVSAQRPQLPDAPPPPKYKPKPTPTPTPIRAEDIDVVRVNSNLVMVPVSVVDPQGVAVHGLQINDFRLEEHGKQQEIAQIGNPEQVPLDIALLSFCQLWKEPIVPAKGGSEFRQTRTQAG